MCFTCLLKYFNTYRTFINDSIYIAQLHSLIISAKKLSIHDTHQIHCVTTVKRAAILVY